MTPTIRKIQPDDIPVILELMRDFAIFDGSSDEVAINKDRLADAYFKSTPDLFALVALIDDKVVGFMNYMFSFSSFELKYCLWVEDVFIKDSFRRKGIGVAFFNTAKEIAKEKECARLEWLVRKDNLSGIDFYEKIKAKVDHGTIYVKWNLT